MATIENESLTPVSLLTASSPSATFADNVNSLVLPALADAEPLYLLLKRYDTAPRLVAVSYIPDIAKVRQKMLFASTRLTLVRELGREHFRDTIYATTRDELTPEGFEKHDKHEQLEAPLTEQERDLEGVKQAEAAEGARGTGSRELNLGQRMAMPVLDNALAALKELKPDGGRSLVMLVCYYGPLVSVDGSKRTNSHTNQIRSSHYRKSTQKPRKSSSSQTRPRRPRYPS